MATPAKIIDQNLPTVAIVGRTNVGKSTLFNRLTEQSAALVSPIAGTTRTRNIGVVSWRGKNFSLIDSGGLNFTTDDLFAEEIMKQTQTAISQADLIIFLIDIKSGVLPQEKQLAKQLRPYSDRVMLIANKADSEKLMAYTGEQEIMALGFGQPMAVSAASGANLGDMLDIILKRLGKLPKRPKKLKALRPIKVALIGRPNVGKSSLFNSLIGSDDVIVSPIAHTTREPYDTLMRYNKQPILFIDTAGIRRKTKVNRGLELIGIKKSLQCVDKSDIVLLVLDASDSIASQDKQLGGLLREHTRSVIIIVNKWDLAEANDDHFRNQVRDMIYKAFPHLDFCPIIFTSAKTNYRTHQIFPAIIQAWQARQTIITENALSKFMQKVTRDHRPAKDKGTKHPQILGFHQINCAPPIFELVVKANTSLHSSYLNYIANRLRDKFNFFAAPIVIKIKKMKK